VAGTPAKDPASDAHRGGRGMSTYRERFVNAGGRSCRIWEKGEGAALFWLASAPLLYRWTAIHDALAAQCRLIVCSLPGLAGNGRNHDDLNDHLDWCLAAHDLIVAAGFSPADTLMGSSTVGALAADVAAIWPDLVERLILVAPHGLFDLTEPTRDMFALHPRDAATLLSAKPDLYKAQIAAPADVQPVLWSIETIRSSEATARFLWPLGDTRLSRRLSRITARTCVVWGEQDRIIPPSYAQRFCDVISGPVTVVTIPGAGHVAEIDEPEAIAGAVRHFSAAAIDRSN
jgi:pimeloyl-ACP methyl ester carboxylesterase